MSASEQQASAQGSGPSATLPSERCSDRGGYNAVGSYGGITKIHRANSSLLSDQGKGRKHKREGGKHQPRPHTKKGLWSAEEELAMAMQHMEVGNKWSAISKFLPARSDNDVKNHWNSTLRSKSRVKHCSLLWLYAKQINFNQLGDSIDSKAPKQRQQCFEVAQQERSALLKNGAHLAATQRPSRLGTSSRRSGGRPLVPDTPGSLSVRTGGSTRRKATRNASSDTDTLSESDEESSEEESEEQEEGEVQGRAVSGRDADSAAGGDREGCSTGPGVCDLQAHTAQHETLQARRRSFLHKERRSGDYGHIHHAGAQTAGDAQPLGSMGLGNWGMMGSAQLPGFIMMGPTTNMSGTNLGPNMMDLQALQAHMQSQQMALQQMAMQQMALLQQQQQHQLMAFGAYGGMLPRLSGPGQQFLGQQFLGQVDAPPLQQPGDAPSSATNPLDGKAAPGPSRQHALAQTQGTHHGHAQGMKQEGQGQEERQSEPVVRGMDTPAHMLMGSTRTHGHCSTRAMPAGFEEALALDMEQGSPCFDGGGLETELLGLGEEENEELLAIDTEGKDGLYSDLDVQITNRRESQSPSGNMCTEPNALACDSSVLVDSGSLGGWQDKEDFDACAHDSGGAMYNSTTGRDTTRIIFPRNYTSHPPSNGNEICSGSHHNPPAMPWGQPTRQGGFIPMPISAPHAQPTKQTTEQQQQQTQHAMAASLARQAAEWMEQPLPSEQTMAAQQAMAAQLQHSLDLFCFAAAGNNAAAAGVTGAAARRAAASRQHAHNGGSANNGTPDNASGGEGSGGATGNSRGNGSGGNSNTIANQSPQKYCDTDLSAGSEAFEASQDDVFRMRKVAGDDSSGSMWPGSAGASADAAEVGLGGGFGGGGGRVRALEHWGLRPGEGDSRGSRCESSRRSASVGTSLTASRRGAGHKGGGTGLATDLSNLGQVAHEMPHGEWMHPCPQHRTSAAGPSEDPGQGSAAAALTWAGLPGLSAEGLWKPEGALDRASLMVPWSCVQPATLPGTPSTMGAYGPWTPGQATPTGGQQGPGALQLLDDMIYSLQRGQDMVEPGATGPVAVQAHRPLAGQLLRHKKQVLSRRPSHQPPGPAIGGADNYPNSQWQ